MTNEEIRAGYYLRQNGKRTAWLVDGPDGWTYVGLRGGSRETAVARILEHAAKPAPVAATPVAPTAQPMAAGWSNAAQRRAGRPTSHDLAGDMMSNLLGTSPAAPGTCHYCGLSTRTHDCY